mgnify:CR=1 FL=1
MNRRGVLQGYEPFDEPPPRPGLGARLRRRLGPRPDEVLLRLLFRCLILATVVVLGLDLADMEKGAGQDESWRERLDQPLVPGEEPAAEPYLPSSRPESLPGQRPVPGGGPGLHEAGDARAPMTFDLLGEGRLLAVGTITPGTAERFATEIEKRGSYVREVVLNSRGGSVMDALAMGRLIRERGLSTAVEGRSYCASSCPLVFAGGVARRVGSGAVIGVHQIFSPSGALATAGAGGADGMDRAQRVSALCQRYLADMGVDLRVWLHAMETPRDALFYFTPEELTDLKLATVLSDASAGGGRASG